MVWCQIKCGITDERGVMTYEWTIATGSGASVSDWKYFNSPEDGARATKGWFKVVAPAEDNDNVFSSTYDKTFAEKDAEDENERWYYAGSQGELAEGEIKKIKGKYYGFRPEDDGEGKGAAMLSGLVLMKVQDDQIIDVADDGIDSDELSDLLDGDYDDLLNDGYTLFYFGNDEDSDGAMKTGSVTISLDGDSYNFQFSKAGGSEGKGRGVTGVDDNKYIYKAGCRIKADSDDKYQVVEVTGADGVDVSASGVMVKKIDDLRDVSNSDRSFINDDDETVRYGVFAGKNYFLVNTAGSVQKNKTAAKDGNDWYFYVKNRDVKLYSNNKNMDDRSTTTSEKWDDYLTQAELDITNN